MSVVLADVDVELGEGEGESVLGKFFVESGVHAEEHIPVVGAEHPCAHGEVDRACSEGCQTHHRLGRCSVVDHQRICLEHIHDDLFGGGEVVAVAQVHGPVYAAAFFARVVVD